MNKLVEIGSLYGLDLSATSPWTLATLTDKLILGLSDLCQEQRGLPRNCVVILVDEYDAPIVKVLDANGGGAREQAKANIGVLSSFFDVIKACSDQRKLTFVTGVSKFGKTALFSSPNFLVDISLNEDYSAIVGFTWDEIVASCGPQLDALAARHGWDRAHLERVIRDKYGPGWSWGGKERVFNPIDIGELFFTGKFGDHWTGLSATGWLFKLVKPEHRSRLARIEYDDWEMVEFTKIEVDNLGTYAGDVVSLLLQCGYITIMSTELREGSEYCKLGYPTAFAEKFSAHGLFETLLGVPANDWLVRSIRSHIQSGDLRALFAEDVAGQFSAIPHSATAPTGITGWEAYYHAGTMLTLRVAGVHVIGEVTTSSGRADLWFKICGGRQQTIVELKCAATSGPEAAARIASGAIQQIHARNYSAIAEVGLPIKYVGVVFDSGTRTVAEGGVLVEDGAYWRSSGSRVGEARLAS
jgi:hypothetical protein